MAKKKKPAEPPPRVDLFSLPKVDIMQQYRDQVAALLPEEQEILKTDREFYLECLRTPLSERKTLIELRDGLILFWNIYKRCKQEQAADEH